MGESIDYYELRTRTLKHYQAEYALYEWDEDHPFLIESGNPENQPDVDRLISETISELLDQKGIEGQEEIRKRLLCVCESESDIPSTRQTIAKHLQEPHQMKRPEAMAYCRLLGVELDYLRCRTQYNEPEGIYTPQHIAEAYSSLYDDQKRAITALMEQMEELAMLRNL